MIKLNKFYKMVAYFEQAFMVADAALLSGALMPGQGHDEDGLKNLVELSKRKNVSRDFIREMEVCLLSTELDRQRYFKRVYEESGIFLVLAHLKMLSKEYTDYNFLLKDKILHIMEGNFRQPLQGLAELIWNEAVSVGIKTLKKPAVLVDELIAQGGWNFWQPGKRNGNEFSVSGFDSSNLSRRVLIFAHKFKSEASTAKSEGKADPENYLTPRQKGLKFAKEMGFKEAHTLIQYYTTDESSNNFKPPSILEISEILNYLQDEPVALGFAKKSILEMLRKDTALQTEAKYLIDTFH